jgi:hypothetical protein
VPVVSAPLLPDERLAWLAARDYCTAKSKQHRPGFWLLYVLGARRHRGGAVRAEANNEKLKLYAVAVDQLVERLNPDERRTLRMDRRLPGWFLPAVDETYERLARIRRSS